MANGVPRRDNSNLGRRIRPAPAPIPGALRNPDRRAARIETGLRDVAGGNRNWRLINLHGRTYQPDDVIPTYYGDSVGKWDGDTFVVNTLGFNNLGGLDVGGHSHSKDLRVQERFTRRDFSHIDAAVTIIDPKTFTKPFTITFVERLLPDTDVSEHICLED
jgi:hypothetical protein